MLQTTVGCAAEVGYARVGKEVEAASLSGVYYRRAVYALEAVYNEYLTFGIGGDVC